MKNFFLLLSIVITCGYTNLFSDEAITKAYRALHLQNPKEALRLSSTSSDAYNKKRIELLALAALHNEEKLIAAIKEAKASNFAFDDLLLELISWHIINAAHHNSAPEVRAATLVAASVAQDAQSVQILLHALSDPQIPIKLMALHFAKTFHDDVIKEAICNILSREEAPELIEEALSTLIAMKAYEVAPEIRNLSEKAKTAEIKKKLLFASIELQEKISRNAIEELLKSAKQSDHMLALSAVLQKNPEDIDVCIPLLSDSSEEVVCATLISFGIIRPQVAQETLFQIETLMQKSSSKVRICAAFALLCMQENTTALSFLENQLQSENPAIRLYTAALISRSGTKGIQIAKRALPLSQDPFVQLNLAPYLIREHAAIDIAKKALIASLETKEKMMKQQDFAFSYICKSTSLRTPTIPRYPETVDLLERLDCLRILATVDKKEAVDKTKNILHDTGWGIAFTASVILLQEGGTSSYEFIRPLLHDEDTAIRTQAAIVLAAFMQDEEAQEVLEKAFESASQIMKEQILYSIASIGESKSIPFLTDLLTAPSIKIRTEAASAIISCLNH